MIKNDKNQGLTPVWALVLLDAAALGAALCLFALFHHVLPRSYEATEPQVIAAMAPVSTPDPTPKPPEAVVGTATEAEPTPTPDPWAAYFSDAPAYTAEGYTSPNISLSLTMHQEDYLTYYMADVRLRDMACFKTAFAGGEYKKGVREEVLDMAVENNAVLAMTGDFYGMHDSGLVIRNGVLYRDNLSRNDVCVVSLDGSMKTYKKDEFPLDEALNGAWQAWSFGPRLLENGQPIEDFGDSTIAASHPRSALGYIEPYHFVFLVADGRQGHYSKGLTLVELSQLMSELGCREAYNLDGGKSAVMAFNGALANQPTQGGRSISDILYIGEVTQ